MESLQLKFDLENLILKTDTSLTFGTVHKNAEKVNES